MDQSSLEEDTPNTELPNDTNDPVDNLGYAPCENGKSF